MRPRGCVAGSLCVRRWFILEEYIYTPRLTAAWLPVCLRLLIDSGLWWLGVFGVPGPLTLRFGRTGCELALCTGRVPSPASPRAFVPLPLQTSESSVSSLSLCVPHLTVPQRALISAFPRSRQNSPWLFSRTRGSIQCLLIYFFTERIESFGNY